TFTSFGHMKPQNDCTSATCLSKRRPLSRNPDPSPTYNSLPSNARIASFFWCAPGYFNATPWF
ncbi:hypothetical protein PHMEG_00041080, partial [Phytophthora megakarya]